MQKTDWQLVEAVRGGSQDAFAVLVSRYQRQVANLVYLSLGNRQDAEDLTQEVFFRFYQTIPRLEQRESVFPWLYRIAANLCIDESRRRAVRKVISLDFLVDEGVGDRWLEDDAKLADDAIVEDEERDRILRALARLPSAMRIVVIMRDYEGLSYQEIAEVLGISLASTKTRLFRARTRLADLLSHTETHT